MQNFKNIHIGTYIKQRVDEKNISLQRICKFFQTNEQNILKIYQQKSVDTDLLLRWCKLLEYDFFRLYVTHLLLYDGISHTKNNKTIRENGEKIHFRKNIYSKEIRDFITELVITNQKTISQIILEYNIPKTTIYQWLRKRNNSYENVNQ